MDDGRRLGVLTAVMMVTGLCLGAACDTEDTSQGGTGQTSQAGSGGTGGGGGSGGTTGVGGTTATAGAGGSAWVLPDDCLADSAGPLLLDTTDECGTSEPSVERAVGLDPLLWQGVPHLLLNEGNEIRFFDLVDPANPYWLHSSNFNVPNMGDSDYDLLDLAVCNECRYGAATYKTEKILFDLGTGPEPYPSVHQHYPHFDDNGSCTFQHEGQQYLVATGYTDSCQGSVGTLYEIDGVLPTDLTQIGCVAGSEGGTVDGCFHIPGAPTGYVYLGTRQRRLYVYEITSSGSSLALEQRNLGADTIYARFFRSSGVAFDLAASPPLFVTVNFGNIEIFDISNPATPTLVSTTTNPTVDVNLAALRSPLLWVSRQGYNDVFTFDVSDPTDPVAYQPDFWNPTHPWNDIPCVGVRDAQFSPDGSGLYIARYSVGQAFDLSACWP